jgi:hypothetical protein
MDAVWELVQLSTEDAWSEVKELSNAAVWEAKQLITDPASASHAALAVAYGEP